MGSTPCHGHPQKGYVIANPGATAILARQAGAASSSLEVAAQSSA